MVTTTKAYDGLNRLTLISTTRPDSTVITSHGYSLYDAANQRRRVDLEDGSYWLYDYDALGQLISAKRFWSGGTPVAGQQFEYQYDDIGNRQSTRSGGDQAGGNLRQSIYSPNELNQYTQRTVPGYVDVIGEAEAGATLTVNNRPTVRQGPPGQERYWRAEIPVDNAQSAVYAEIAVVGVHNPEEQGEEDVVTEEIGRMFVPADPEAFIYDADGNLEQDGRWTYEWDAENRLIAMETSTAAIPDPIRIEFQYDHLWRRTRKTVKNAQTGQPISSVKYVWDGWLLIAELDALDDDALLRSYMWGLDLSGSLEGAGGIGGLLAMTTAAGASYFYAYDGNGNVVRLIDASDPSTPAATYVYEPYGIELVSTGPAAGENPFRFSTKHHQHEDGIIYYGYRYYNPELGRWINRDPIEERGGVNLYGFVGNNAILDVDLLGLAHITNNTGEPLLILVKIYISRSCRRWFRQEGHLMRKGIPGVPLVLPDNRSTRFLSIVTVTDADAFWSSHAPGTGGVARKTGGWGTYEIDMSNITTAGRNVGTFRAEFYNDSHSLQQHVNSLMDVTYRDIMMRGRDNKCCTDEDLGYLNTAVSSGRYALETFPEAQ